MSSRLDSAYWTVVFAGLAIGAIWQVGTDIATDALLGAAGAAAALACWRRTRHLAQWLAGGVAAVSGALLTLVFEAAMNGAPEDPSTVTLVFSFAGGAAVSAVLHNAIARAQAERDRALDDALAALATSARIDELEQQLCMALKTSATRPRSWRGWWAARPPVL